MCKCVVCMCMEIHLKSWKIYDVKVWTKPLSMLRGSTEDWWMVWKKTCLRAVNMARQRINSEKISTDASREKERLRKNKNCNKKPLKIKRKPCASGKLTWEKINVNLNLKKIIKNEMNPNQNRIDEIDCRGHNITHPG